MVRCGGQWVIDGDRMLMYFDGRPYKHVKKKDAVGLSTEVGIGVAASPIDRFAGLRPLDSERPGYAVVEIPAGAEALSLNCDVPEGSQITASVRYPDGCRIRTHTDEECEPIRAGGLRVPVAWKGGRGLPRDLGPLHLRIRLCGGAVAYAVYPVA